MTKSKIYKGFLYNCFMKNLRYSLREEFEQSVRDVTYIFREAIRENLFLSTEQIAGYVPLFEMLKGAKRTLRK
jgi:hypothetical protein